MASGPIVWGRLDFITARALCLPMRAAMWGKLRSKASFESAELGPESEIAR